MCRDFRRPPQYSSGGNALSSLISQIVHEEMICAYASCNRHHGDDRDVLPEQRDVPVGPMAELSQTSQTSRLFYQVRRDQPDTSALGAVIDLDPLSFRHHNSTLHKGHCITNLRYCKVIPCLMAGLLHFTDRELRLPSGAQPGDNIYGQGNEPETPAATAGLRICLGTFHTIRMCRML